MARAQQHDEPVDELAAEALEQGEPVPAEPTEERAPGDWGNVLVVRYKGSSDIRELRRWDFTGDRHALDANDYLSWNAGNAKSLPWSAVVDLAGSEEAAKALLGKMLDEFELDGPGAQDLDLRAQAEDEFSIGGPVAE